MKKDQIPLQKTNSIHTEEHSHGRNASIDFLKVFFLFLIILHHGVVKNYQLYMGVDFFFIVSGYYLGAKYHSSHANPLQYMRGRIRRLYPDYILSYLCFVLLMVILHIPAPETYHPLYELLLMQNIGLPEGGGLNKPLWYLSVLFYGSLIQYVVLWLIGRFAKRTNRMAFLFFLAGTAAGYLMLYLANPDTIEQWSRRFVTPYLLFVPYLTRGTAGLALGIVCFCLIQRFHNTITKLSPLDLPLLLLIVIMMTHGASDYLILFTEGILALIALSDGRRSLLNLAGRSRLACFLARYEYPAYLNHYFIVVLFDHFAITSGRWILVPGAVLLLSMALSWLRKWICRCMMQSTAYKSHNKPTDI